MFRRATEPIRSDLARTLAFPGLCSIGRNGEFDQLLMEDVYWRTLRKVPAFAAKECPNPA